jgi:hypothetical protein
MGNVADSKLADSVRESQQKNAAASKELAKLDKAIAKKKEFLAEFGITDFTSKGIASIDFKKIDAEWVRRRDEAAMAKAVRQSTSRAEGLSAAANAAPEHTGAMVPASSLPSSDVAAPMAGPNPAVEGSSLDGRPSTTVLVDRTREQDVSSGNDTAMAEGADEEEEATGWLSVCLRHWACGDCGYGEDCRSPHKWADELLANQLFIAQREQGKLPPHSLVIMQERGLLR